MFVWNASLLRASVACLFTSLLVAGAPLAAADGHFRVDHVPFTLGFPLPLETPCDEGGLGAVRFCDALEGDYEWTKFTLSVRDGIGVPIGGYFAFRGEDGTVLFEGTFCKDYTNKVPLMARELYVEAGVPEAQCLNPGTIGNVIVAWRVAPDAPVIPPDECDDL